MPRTPSLSIQSTPVSKAIPDFWNTWVSTCRDMFPCAPDAVESIRAFEQHVQTNAVFLHLDDPLETLILDAHTNVTLPEPAWLSLTVLVLRHATVGPLAQKDARATMLSAINRARTLYNTSKGQPINGFSMDHWLALVPSHNNAFFWTGLFQHGLQLVHPQSEPFYWHLREHWLTTEHAHTALDLFSAESPFGPDLPPWGFARAITLSNVQSVLRCGKRWVSRHGSTLETPVFTCTPDPRWLSIYQFSLWLVHIDNHFPVSQQTLDAFKALLTPDTLAYWLVLTYDSANHASSTRDLVDALNLHEHADYPRAINMLNGLQLLESPDELSLAFQAWTLWQEFQQQSPLALPELG